MAVTYSELFSLRSNSELLNKITTAIAIKCKDVIDSSSIIVQKDWARKYLKDPESLKDKIIWSLLVANKDVEVSVITEATDSNIQSAVNTAIDNLIADMSDPTP
jgi:hypothetical protein